MPGLRMAVVWCPDWPITTWGVPPEEPAVVLVANRVVATSRAARSDGVEVGQRRRQAQALCPDLAILNRDVDREARLFEPVVAVLDAITPRVEVTGPGLVGFPTRGPSRFFGGDAALADHMLDTALNAAPRRSEVRVAIADSVFAARLAARATDTPLDGTEVGKEAGVEAITLIPPGGSAEFLSDISIAALEMPELVETLSHLGLQTLGLFAQLTPADVIGRFGREGQLAHRLAQGEDDYPPDLRRPALDLAATWTFEPPVERIERCAFAVKVLADEFNNSLSSRGLACTRVGIEAETENGEIQKRLWRHEGTLSTTAIADRARWQLDGWLNQSVGKPSSGILRLTLIPDEVVPAVGRQLGLWGGSGEWGGNNDRADGVSRVVARLQALLGSDSVTVPEFRGGVGPGEQLTLVPAVAVNLAEDRPATQKQWIAEPWPGQLPLPSPARVYVDPIPVELVDAEGRPVTVTGRGEITAPPFQMTALRVAGQSRGNRTGHVSSKISKWAGPWPSEQRWWDPLTSRRQARLQVVLEDQAAHLLTVERGSWCIEASYA